MALIGKADMLRCHLAHMIAFSAHSRIRPTERMQIDQIRALLARIADDLSPYGGARQADSLTGAAQGITNIVASGRIQGVSVDAKDRINLVLEVRSGETAEAVGALARECERAIKEVDATADVRHVLTAHHAGNSAVSNVSAGKTVRLQKGRPVQTPPATAGQTSPPPARRQAPAGQGPARQAIEHIGQIIAVASGKGGVGKSSVAVHLALALARLGVRVGLLDADIYGPSLPTMFGLVKASPEIGADKKLQPIEKFGIPTMSIGFLVDPDAPMIWRGPIVSSAITQMLNDVAWARAEAPLDVLIIDMPPGTGDAQLTIAQRASLAGAIIVSTPQEVALIDARRAIAMFEKTHIPILGLVENMAYYREESGRRSFPFGEGGARRTAEQCGVPFLGEIPLDSAIGQACDAGIPLLVSDPDGEIASIFLAIGERLLTDRLAQPSGRQPPEILFSDL